MPNTTPNYNLTKPLETENYDVNIVNSNSDKIDAALKANADAIAQLDADKVDAVSGKQLSDENYTLPEKNKVANLPDNTIAQLAEKVQNFKIKNEITNGDFSGGTTGWTANNSNISVVDNALSLLATAANGQVVSTSFPNVIGNKLYIKFRYKFPNAAVQFSIAGISGSQAPIPSPNFDNTWRDFSYEWACTLNGNYGIRLRDTRASAWTVAQLDKVVIIDKTAIFGVGNEPTNGELDALISVLGGWFDGELTLTQKQYVNWMLKLMRQNRNAIIALGGTIV